AWLEELKRIQGSHRKRRPRGGQRPFSSPLDSELPTEFDRLPIAVQRRSVQIQLRGLGIEPAFDLVETLRMSPERPIAVAVPSSSESSVSPAGRVSRSRSRPDARSRIEF